MLSDIVFGGASFASTENQEHSGYSLGDLVNCSATAIFEAAFENGITHYDFAPIYGFDHAEKTMGKVIGDKREKIKLISKGGVDWHDNGRVNMDNRPKTIKKMFEKSLKNFNCDYIDIYFIHWPSKETDIRYAIEVLEKFRSQGKVHHIGLSNTFKEDFFKAKEVAPISYIQNEYNLFHQNNFFPNDCVSMGWGTFDKGILAGSVKKDRKFDSADARSHAFWWKKSNWKERVDFVNKVKEKFNIDNRVLKAIALQCSLDQGNLPILGMKSLEHIEELKELINLDVLDYKDEVISEFTLF